MKRKDKLCFVQFIHPGREHVPDKNNHKDWNIYSHKRKFLVNKGSYVSNASNKEVKVAEIGFWGEWEPQSQVIKVDNPVSNGPRYI